MTAPVKMYRRKLKKALRCGPVLKKRLLGQFSEMLGHFLEESPAPDTEQLTEAFGTPEALAASLLEELPPEVVSRSAHYSKYSWAAIMLLAVLLTALVVYCLVPREINLTMTQTTVIEEVKEVD